MASEITALTNTALLASDVISSFLLFVGTLYLSGVLKIFCGNKLKDYAMMIGIGLLLFTVIHEFGEFVYGAGMHGSANLDNVLESIHVLLGFAGALIFFKGCYGLYKTYSEYIKR